MHPRCCRPATSWVHYTTSCNTQSSAPEDGRDNHPKHVKLIGIINRPLLLHLVGVYIIYINDAQSNKYQTFQFFILHLFHPRMDNSSRHIRHTEDTSLLRCHWESTCSFQHSAGYQCFHLHS